MKTKMSKNCSYDPVKKIWSGKSCQKIYNTEANVGYLFLQKIIQTPERIFQVSHEIGLELTNGQIYERSIKFAEFLNKSGLKQGDIVGLIASNSENIAPLFIACFLLGIAVNPLAIVMDENDIIYMWSKLKPKVIFSDAKIINTVKNAVDKMELDTKIYSMINKIKGFPFVASILEEEVDVKNFEFPDLPNISATTATINCSSGTTNAPKGICKPHSQIIAHSFLPFKQNFDKSDVIFGSNPSYWSIHQFFMTFGIMYSMKSIITAEILTPELWMDIVEEHKITYAFLSPRLAAMILKSKKLRKMDSIRVVTMGGNVFTEKLVKDLREIFPNGKVLVGYGLTEADYVAISNEDEGTIGLSSGYPFFNVQVKIIDEDGTALGPNETVEIYYKTDVPFSGYFKDSKNYADSFDSDNFIKSGDVGYFDDAGRIYIINRIKHMIIGNGSLQITPIEIEMFVNEIDGVLESCVVGVLDEEVFYDRIYCFVVKDEGKVDLTEEFIENYVNGKVSESKKITGGVYFIDEIPATPTGKILNRELKKLATEIQASKKTKNLNGF